ncbi:hypothetical protein HQ40_01665 [Porphyromonas gulae]|nr:hypothetical protein HQ40_01665 [Porphyromonas gulae]
MKSPKSLLWLFVAFVPILLGYGIVSYVQLLESTFESRISSANPFYRMADYAVCLPDSMVSERERELFYIAKIYGLIEYKSTFYKEKYAYRLLLPYYKR